jgi:hypothetical protein
MVRTSVWLCSSLVVVRANRADYIPIWTNSTTQNSRSVSGGFSFASGIRVGEVTVATAL